MKLSLFHLNCLCSINHRHLTLWNDQPISHVLCFLLLKDLAEATTMMTWETGLKSIGLLVSLTSADLWKPWLIKLPIFLDFYQVADWLEVTNRSLKQLMTSGNLDFITDGWRWNTNFEMWKLNTSMWVIRAIKWLSRSLLLTTYIYAHLILWKISKLNPPTGVTCQGERGPRQQCFARKLAGSTHVISLPSGSNSSISSHWLSD